MSERKEIGFERLVDWVEGRLPEEEARTMTEQLRAADEETRARAEWLRAFTRTSERTSLVAPPVEVRENLSRRFAAYVEGSREPGLLRRVVATLSFEGGMQPALGVRSARTGEAQGQLVYSTDVVEIALNVHPRPAGKVDLDGQLFPVGDVEPGGFVVQLLSGGADVGITTTDELGEFGFESIASGEYEILISDGGVEIQLSPVRVGA
ncbi:MAG: hypothetical protein M3151_07510 [Actinomycetota bacterium]|nr:hypothetical protein [Actinomycetota bacterium]